MNNTIDSYLQSIEISHLFAHHYSHGVEIQKKWDRFEPTRFVYAFFAFNMLYAIDWELTFQGNKIAYQPAKKDNTAKNQFLSLITFIHKRIPESFRNALLKLSDKKEFHQELLKMEYDWNSTQKSNRNQKDSVKQACLNASKKYFENKELSADDHFDLLQMSYTVRNNLFHGEKKAHKMKELGHRKRLFHYANILLATNECFFEVISTNFDYRRMEDWEVADNI